MGTVVSRTRVVIPAGTRERLGKAWEFVQENADLPRRFRWGDVVFEYKRVSSTESRIVMYLQLEEDATIEALRDSWWQISEWKRRLLDGQGPQAYKEEGAIYRRLEELHTQGSDPEAKAESCQKLADRENTVIVQYLTDAIPEYREWRGSRPGQEPDSGDFWDQVDKGRFGSVYQALWVLQTLGITPKDSGVWCISILENLLQGRKPFLPNGGPITPEHIRSRLRAWRRKKTS